jgi:sulfate permease, SulP family
MGSSRCAQVHLLFGRKWRRTPSVYEREPRVIVIDHSAIPDLEYTTLKMLTESENKLQQSRISLWLAGLNPEPLQLIQKSALGQTLGRCRMYFNLEQAIRSYLKQFGDPNAGRAA